MTNRLTQKTRPITCEWISPNKYKISVMFRRSLESTYTHNIKAVEVILNYRCSEHYTVQQAYETLHNQIKADRNLK